MTHSSTTVVMSPLRAWRPPRSTAIWRDVVLPREHGSWSLAFEPLAFGLLAAPSVAGAWFGLAVAAGFVCRRPLRLALREARPDRRRAAWGALMGCAGIALAAVGVAVALAGVAWMAWLLPALIGSAVFAVYDFRNDGRDEVAEIAGTAAFASVPAALAVLGGWSPGQALTLGGVMLGRAVPTVIFVRAAVRGRKVGSFNFRPAFWLALGALLVAGALACIGSAPGITVVWFVFFFMRVAEVRNF